MKGGGIMNKMKGVIIVVLLTIAFLISPVQAEDFEDTRCFSGTVTVFHTAPLVLSWAQNAIIMSDDKRFNNMVAHCEGVQMGLGQKREGYGLCKATDVDGDMMIYGGNYGAPGAYVWKFKLGTGKWKGIKGTFTTQRIVRSKPRKGAMPQTYQGCTRVKGTFELPPK
jgi:hypothetical protein